MAFTEPFTLGIGGSTKNLVRIDSGRGASEYLLTEAHQEFRAVIRSQELKVESDGRKRIRHNLSARWTVFATSTVPQLVRIASVTFEHYFGDDVTVYDDLVLAVADQMSSGNIAKLNNFES